MNYKITLVYFWLTSPAEAMARVALLVSKGGHDIPQDIIERRYYRGLNYLFDLYMVICDLWMLVNNATEQPELVARGEGDFAELIFNHDIWNIIKKQAT